MATINLGSGNVTATETVDNTTITAGDGKDSITVYGHDDILQVGNGNNTIIIRGVNDTLIAGNGKNTVNVNSNFTLAVDGLAGPTNVINPIFTAANAQFTGLPVYDDGSTLPLSLYGETYSWGPVSMTLGNGTNVVYGDLDTFSLISSNADYVSSSVDPITGGYTGIEDGVITDETFNFAASTISLGSGNNDIIYGNLHTLILNAQQGTLGPQFYNGGEIGGIGSGQNLFSFASNTLSERNGNNDAIYGNVGDIALLANPGGNIGSFGWLGDTPPGGGNYFSFGTMVDGHLIGNILSVGNGNNDSLYGTAHDLNLLAHGSAGIGGLGDGSSGGNTFAFGDNNLHAGNDNNDQLYGTLHDVVNIGDNALGAPTIGSFFGGHADNIFGNNMLMVGSGNNDVLYGTMHNLSFQASNGAILGGIGTGYYSFLFGNNILVAGNGTNDTLYGTLQDISMVAIGHDSADPTHYTTIGGVFGDAGNKFIFGDNVLTAGKGNDTLFGSMHDLQISHDTEGSLQSNIIQFGTNVLNAGTGNNTLVGQLNNIDFFEIPAGMIGATSANVASLANFDGFLANNTIISGMNTFNLHGGVLGGSGVDTLVFDPAIDIGINIMNFFDSSKDMLSSTMSCQAVQRQHLRCLI